MTLKSLPNCRRSVRNDMRLFLRAQQYPVLLRTTKYWKVLLQYYSVLQSTTPALLRTTKRYFSSTLYYQVLFQYYSSTTLYYKVPQYYFVLQSTTPVLLCTTKYYFVLPRTTTYYSVLRQYYSSTTKYYSSSTQHYSVLLQYYSILQSTILQYYSALQSTTRLLQSSTPVLLRTTKYTPVLLRTTKYYSSTTPVLHCTTKYHSWLILVTYEMSFTLARLPRRKTHMLFPRHIWNTMRGATGATIQPHQILPLPGKMTLRNLKQVKRWKVFYNAGTIKHDPSLDAACSILPTAIANRALSPSFGKLEGTSRPGFSPQKGTNHGFVKHNGRQRLRMWKKTGGWRHHGAD